MSSIEWTNVTWNPVSGCTRASEGCDKCYAVTMTHRLEAMGQKKYAGLTVLNGKGDRHFNGVVRTHDDVLQLPFKWKKPQRVFVNSMSDLFHKDVPFEFIDKVFAVMALCPQHTFQVLTKRPERMAEYLKLQTLNDRCWAWKSYGNMTKGDAPVNYAAPLPNVWLGTSCENQKAADERIPHLLRCPAAVRFLSCEPLLGAINLEIVGDGLGESGETCPPALPAISWCIVGGESGPGARPCNIDWIRSIVSQCKAAGVACFVKQLGAQPFDPRAAADGPGHGDSHLDSLGWPAGTRFKTARSTDGYIRPNGEIRLDDGKGGDMNEFPADLQVREFPKAGRV